MRLEDVKAIVKNEHAEKYRVKYADGKTTVVRLWRHTDGCVAIMSKGKKIYGHYLSSYSWDGLDNWVSLTKVNAKGIDYKKRLIRRAKDAHKMLSESGLWKDIKKEIEDFLALSDEQIDEFVKAATSDFYNDVYRHLYDNSNKFPWLHTYQVFESFLSSSRCWKSPNFGHWWRSEKQVLKNAIENKRNYNHKWREGYDNSIEVRFDEDGRAMGWYSEEYKDCGNGHYYLLFDATHAIFYEND